MFLSTHSSLFWIYSDRCRTHINTTRNLSCYSQRFVKKAQWFPQHNFWIMSYILCALNRRSIASPASHLQKKISYCDARVNSNCGKSLSARTPENLKCNAFTQLFSGLVDDSKRYTLKASFILYICLILFVCPSVRKCHVVLWFFFFCLLLSGHCLLVCFFWVNWLIVHYSAP